MVTSEVLNQLPAELPARLGPLYLLTRPGGLTAQQWQLAGVFDQAVLVELPTAAVWLDQRLQQLPDADVEHH